MPVPRNRFDYIRFAASLLAVAGLVEHWPVLSVGKDLYAMLLTAKQEANSASDWCVLDYLESNQIVLDESLEPMDASLFCVKQRPEKESTDATT